MDITGAGTTDGNRKIKFWNEGGAAFSGKIGIGINTPTEMLQVNGNGLFSGRGLFGNYPSSTFGQIAGNNLEVGGASPTGSNPHATIYFHHHGIRANQLRYNGGNFYFERCTNGWESHDPSVSIGDVANLGTYTLGVGGKIAARSAGLTNLEVGGASPTGSNPHATIYFHHHGIRANQLRYNGGNFYFERCTNGWESHDPSVSIGDVANLGTYTLGVGGKIAARSAGLTNLEVGGASPTGSNPHATIYFHHHGIRANQLRYNGGNFYFERCTNGWESHDPSVIIGNVANPGTFRLAVGGKIAANEEVRVFTSGTTSFPDYVFDASYQLPTLEYTEKYIQQHKHLPEVPTAAEIEKEGMSLNGMNEILLKKVEELTLHIIRLSKENEALKKRMEQIEKK